VKKKNKIFKNTLALFLTVLCFCAALSGCAKSKITHISISEVNTPRLIYILGDGLDLSLGALEVTEGKEEKTIPCNDPAVLISGYDQTKLGKQTLTVTYKNKSVQYEITVYSSSVQAIHDSADGLADIYLSEDGINLTREAGELALSAMREYLQLSASERELVNKDKLAIIISPATYHATKLYSEALLSFSDSFSADEEKNLVFVGKEYEKAKADLERLNDERSPINAYKVLLSGIKDSFGEHTLPGGKTVSAFIKLVSDDDLSFIKEALALTTSIYESLAVVPNDWTATDLSNCGEQILAASKLITDGSFIGEDYRYLYDTVNGWRENKDCFDIIYSYYCYVAEGGKDYLAGGAWQTLPLPDMLWNWYSPLYNATKEAVLMAENLENAYYLHDTTDFMLFYRETLSAKEEIKNGSVPLYKDIYEAINGDAIFENNIRRSYGGYLTHAGGMLGNESYHALWEKYLEIVSLEKQNLLNFEEHGELIKDTFNIFASLTPSEVYGFISSLNYLYRETEGATLVLDPDKAYNKFTSILNSFYNSKFPENLKPTFKALLTAIENYAIYSLNGEETGAKDGFNTAIETIKQTLPALSDEDAAIFNSLFGKCYNKYLGIYSYETGNIALKNKFDALYSTLSAYFELLYTEEIPENQSDVYTRLFALHEKAESIYSEILSSKNEGAVTALYCERYDVQGTAITLDTAFYVSRTVFISHLVSILVDDGGEIDGIKPLLYDVYFKTNLGEFLENASSVLEYNSLDKDTVKSVMKSFRELGAKEKKLFYTIGALVYYENLERFFFEKFSDDENAKAFIIAIFEAEYSYFKYLENTEMAEYLDSYKERMMSAISYYALILDHNTRDSYLLDTYRYYTQIYYELISD